MYCTDLLTFLILSTVVAAAAAVAAKAGVANEVI